VVAISQTIVNLLIDAGVERQRIRLIHSGIDAKCFLEANRSTSSTEGPATIGCLAVMEPRKGIQYLLEAVALLRARGIALQCAIAGEGSLRAELQEQARTLGLHENIRFLGFVSDNAAFLDGIDIFVMPSLFEGLGVAALEAMAASKPVVATRVGGLAESVVDGVTGVLVPARDAGALADAVTRLLRDPELAREMGRKGRERVLEHFTLEQMAAKNESYYYELLDELR
jgi:glycosyltransferase involved in cell wall biosynthesis